MRWWASARSTANSATTVLPEPVGAATRTDSPESRAWMPLTWNWSKGNG